MNFFDLKSDLEDNNKFKIFITYNNFERKRVLDINSNFKSFDDDTKKVNHHIIFQIENEFSYTIESNKYIKIEKSENINNKLLMQYYVLTDKGTYVIDIERQWII